MNGTLSIPTPLLHARNTTLFYYTVPIDFPTINDILHDRSIKEHLLSPYIRGFLQVCFLNFCRVTELLNVTFNDIIYPDRILCKGLKRSNSYVVYLPGLSSQIDKSEIIHKSDRLYQITYSMLYRACVRAGIHHHIVNTQNSKRLHSSRYIFCQDAIKLTEESHLSQVMRHRSDSSLQYYL